MLVAGFFTDETSALRLRVYRLLSDGSIDTTYGTSGYAEKILSGDLGNAVIAMAVQADGKVVVGSRPGYIFGYATENFVIVRFDATGQLDTGFGVGGVVDQPIGSSSDIVDSILVQTDGKIVAGGSSVSGIVELADFALIRLNSDGSLDSGFNGSGKLVVPVVSGANDHLVTLLQQSDGKLLSAGYSSEGGPFDTNYDFSVIRVAPDGALDVNFGLAGKMVVNLPGSSEILSPD